MKPQTKTARTYLQQLQTLDACINQKIQEVYQLEKLLKRGRQWLNNTSADSYNNLLHKKKALENVINREIDKFIDKKHEIINQIQGLENGFHVTVLYKIYVEYKGLHRVAREMYYSLDHIKRLQYNALLEFEEKYL